MTPYGKRINITNFTGLQRETEDRKDKRKITRNIMQVCDFLVQVHPPILVFTVDKTTDSFT